VSPVITIILSLLSSILAAFLTHYLTLRRKKYDELSEFRINAYVDFINAVTKLVTARRKGNIEDQVNELAALNDAKTRICICAETKIVKELKEFWEYGGTLERECEVQAFTRLCLHIRESLGNKKYDIHNLHISNILFKLEPSSYSFRKDDTYKK